MGKIPNGPTSESSRVLHDMPHFCDIYELPRDKTNKMTVRPAKTQISLGIRTKANWRNRFGAKWPDSLRHGLYADSLFNALVFLLKSKVHWKKWKYRILASDLVQITLLVLSWGGSYIGCNNVEVDKKAMIRNWYNQIPHAALNNKRERDTYN